MNSSFSWWSMSASSTRLSHLFCWTEVFCCQWIRSSAFRSTGMSVDHAWRVPLARSTLKSGSLRDSHQTSDTRDANRSAASHRPPFRSLMTSLLFLFHLLFGVTTEFELSWHGLIYQLQTIFESPGAPGDKLSVTFVGDDASAAFASCFFLILRPLPSKLSWLDKSWLTISCGAWPSLGSCHGSFSPHCVIRLVDTSSCVTTHAIWDIFGKHPSN